ncbi:Testican-2 [Anabarilius grahami]|uniref:Testican-2 n=1 Tax=Anabarilius grahami TaxID=495550 RepID=A0A3N0YTV4_ANAGA|nr:Testican-2 [Anabarilius grahami]
MVWMNDLGCLLVPLLMLVRFSVQVDVKSGKEAEKTGNFMEDEQWLSTISQYSRKIKHWNRFRDAGLSEEEVTDLQGKGN